MKTKLFFRITTALLISCLLTNCEIQDSGNFHNENVEFAFNLNTNHLKSAPDSCESLSYATKIVLTIETISGGATDYTDTELELYKLNGSFFSPKIALLVGQYRLTKLLLIDDNNNVLFAAPLEGASLASQVENPLPIEFEVIANQAVLVNVGVLCALDYSPEDFGLVSFWLNKVETFSFMIAVAEFGENLLLDADLTITSGDYSYSQQLEAITNNVVTVKDGFENYTLIIEKEGFSAYSKTFTHDELKLHSNLQGNLPLVIELLKNVIDIDGNVYKTVKIGSQIWMAENLRVTHFRDDQNIHLATDETDWITYTYPKYCWYNNDSATYAQTYGALYNSYAAKESSLCPPGWHVPSIEEWKSVINYLGGELTAGGKLKEKGVSHWRSPNEGATDETGFNALPGGYRRGPEAIYPGDFYSMTTGGLWWSSTHAGGYMSYCITMSYDKSWAGISVSNSRRGMSVRCIQD